MAVNVTFLGVTYTIPTTGEEDWGDDLTAFLVALGNNSASGITLSAVGSSPNANGATIGGTTLNLQPSDATHPGVNTILAQTYAGVKTFSSSPVFSTATHVRANRHSSALTLSVGTTAVPFTTEEYDTRGEYDPTTGIFTASEAGYYAVKATVGLDPTAYVAGDTLTLDLYKNGTKLQLGNVFSCEANATEYAVLLMSTTLLLAASDTLQMKCSANGHASAIYSGATTGASTFTIDRLF